MENISAPILNRFVDIREKEAAGTEAVLPAPMQGTTPKG
jgi:hypothetical protein